MSLVPITPDEAPPPSVLDREIRLTWRSASRIGLGVAAEAAVLALIFDSTVGVKIATAVCALLAIGVLEAESRIKAFDRQLFIGVVGLLACVYSLVVLFAIQHAVERQEAERKLRQIYAAGETIIDRKLASHLNGNIPLHDDDAVKQFQTDAEGWAESTQQWLLANLSPAARSKFFDLSNAQTLCWGFVENPCHPVFDQVKNRIISEERNLSDIMEHIEVYRE